MSRREINKLLNGFDLVGSVKPVLEMKWPLGGKLVKCSWEGNTFKS